MRFALLVCVLLSVLCSAVAGPLSCPALPSADLYLNPVVGKENTYRLEFVNPDPTLNADWLDLHIRVAGKEPINIRVASDITAQRHSIVQDGIVLMPGQTVTFSATYSVQGTSCDTQEQTVTVPSGANVNMFRASYLPRQPAAQFQQYPQHQYLRPSSLVGSIGAIPTPRLYGASSGACPALQTEQILTKIVEQENTYKLTFMNHNAGQSNPESVDLKWQVSGVAAPVSVRLASDMNGPIAVQDGIVVLPGQTIRYSVSYVVNGVACDTPVMEFTAPATSEQSAFVGATYPGAAAYPGTIQQLVRSQQADLFNPIQQSRVPQLLRLNPRQPYVSAADASADFGINAVVADDFSPVSGTANVCPLINTEQILSSVDGKENTYSLAFLNHDYATAKPDWCDIHLNIVGKEPMNIRLQSAMTGPNAVQDGIVIMPGQTLTYSVTYFVNGAACDSPTYSFTAPAAGSAALYNNPLSSVQRGLVLRQHQQVALFASGAPTSSSLFAQNPNMMMMPRGSSPFMYDSSLMTQGCNPALQNCAAATNTIPLSSFTSGLQTNPTTGGYTFTLSPEQSQSVNLVYRRPARQF